MTERYLTARECALLLQVSTTAFVEFPIPRDHRWPETVFALSDILEFVDSLPPSEHKDRLVRRVSDAREGAARQSQEGRTWYLENCGRQ